jgi:hypothetical protein
MPANRDTDGAIDPRQVLVFQACNRLLRALMSGDEAEIKAAEEVYDGLDPAGKPGQK